MFRLQLVIVYKVSKNYFRLQLGLQLMHSIMFGHTPIAWVYVQDNL
jgi:hypothetical protein